MAIHPPRIVLLTLLIVLATSRAVSQQPKEPGGGDTLSPDEKQIRQAVVAFVQNPTANLLPLGLIVFAMFGVICLVPTLVGAWFRRWYDRRGADA